MKKVEKLKNVSSNSLLQTEMVSPNQNQRNEQILKASSPQYGNVISVRCFNFTAKYIQLPYCNNIDISGFNRPIYIQIYNIIGGQAVLTHTELLSVYGYTYFGGGGAARLIILSNVGVPGMWNGVVSYQ